MKAQVRALIQPDEPSRALHMLKRIYLNAAFLVVTLSLGLGGLYSTINHAPGWAITFGLYGLLSGACWLWAIHHFDEAERQAPAEPVKPKPQPEADPVMRDLYRQLATAIERKKARNHIRLAIRERRNAVLAGRA